MINWLPQSLAANQNSPSGLQASVSIHARLTPPSAPGNGLTLFIFRVESSLAVIHLEKPAVTFTETLNLHVVNWELVKIINSLCTMTFAKNNDLIYLQARN